MMESNEIVKLLKEKLTLYLVINSEGKFFRAKGYGGYGNSWVDDPSKARMYGKIGPARGVITFFSGNANFPTPKLIKVEIGNISIIDEDDRVKANKIKKIKLFESKIKKQQYLNIENAKKILESLKKG